MTELEMMNKLELGRRLTTDGTHKVYAYSNGKNIILSDEKEEIKGYWVCSIFENGHRTEA